MWTLAVAAFAVLVLQLDDLTRDSDLQAAIAAGASLSLGAVIGLWRVLYVPWLVAVLIWTHDLVRYGVDEQTGLDLVAYAMLVSVGICLLASLLMAAGVVLREWVSSRMQ